MVAPQLRTHTGVFAAYALGAKVNALAASASAGIAARLVHHGETRNPGQHDLYLACLVLAAVATRVIGTHGPCYRTTITLTPTAS